MSLKLSSTLPAGLGKIFAYVLLTQVLILLYLFFYSPCFKTDEEDESSILIIIQCDSGHLNGDLIACARNRIYDVRSEKERDTHVVFVIHLPHQAANSSFVGFQGDPWISVHIDDLRPTSDSTVMPYEAMNTVISQLFLGNISQFGMQIELGGAANVHNNEQSDIEMDTKPSRPSHTEEGTQIPPSEVEDEGESMDEDELAANVENGERMSEGSGPDESEGERMEEEAAVDVAEPQPMMALPPPQCQRLHGCIQAAASRLQDDNKRRATQRVEILVNLIPKDIYFPLGKLVVLGRMTLTIHFLVRSDHLSWNPSAAYFQCFEAERLRMGGRQAVGPQ